MRSWAAVLGIAGGGASALYWGLVPFFSNITYTQSGYTAYYAVFLILSLCGLFGGLLAGVSNRVAPLLMAVAVIPATGALFLPGLLLAVGALLAAGPFNVEAKPAA